MSGSWRQWHRPVELALVLAALMLCFRNLNSSGSGKGLHPVGNGAGRSQTQSRRAAISGSESGESRVAGQLAPGLNIEEGTVDGALIEGPVKVTGSLPPSTMKALPVSSETNEETFKIEASDTGLVMGSFSIQAASARATQGGIRFTGPLRFRYQGDVGQWYELGSVSAESYFFISKDGRKKFLALPAGSQSVPAPPAMQE